MPNLILVKHSLPEIDPSKPAHEWSLSDSGRERCVVLANELAKFEPESMVTSDEPKAIETAAILAARLCLRSTVEPDLREHGRAGVPWMGEDEWQRAMAGFFQLRNELVLGDETANQALVRFSSAIEHVINQAGNRSLAVVAHGTVISLFADSKTGVDAHELWRELELPSFVVLRTESWAMETIVNIG